MSPSRRSLVSCLALGGLLLATSVDARPLRQDAPPHPVRERVARTIVRLLPTPPEPARRFAPVPAARDEQVVVVWLDREPIWTGGVDELQEAFESFPIDQLDPDPSDPPWTRPLDGHEICVGMVIRADSSAHLDEDVFELDCDDLERR